MTRRVPRHIEHLQAQTVPEDVVTLLNAMDRNGHVFHGRCIHFGTRVRCQLGQPCGVIGMVVRD